ncbi:hypothetical protein [Chelativorans sp. AA-79]|uniref:SMc00767 family acetate metabolism repressor n=1 Tax=Chelativorans sp. AA-79 TaxID=3028735 RepID=UPI0023F70DD2|nr:hypothetical protein [Chelativorans sp. AA-79]WEX08753.1 hypothetical protein PVE73_22230 [Chelativorans sp. AA-79]
MKISVKERVEAQATTMDDAQQAAMRRVANDLHRLNQAVVEAVQAGLSVELIRTARHHGGSGNWGDLLTPIIVRNVGSPQ